ncbi:protein UPSTREAM OF FLC-like [Canna indica]|uniref:Protein UPSTREAM OF FLC-like n=1 Tax=Canna indica TaxID=4628 RepID=A0AAQ3KC27_9LILI|nr:protein UPSTREAM OF FLC-like [Canna indica]
MATASSRSRLEPLRQWRVDRETSPERTMVWREPKPKKVPVVYYLSRNGHLEHPHFMEVALSGDGGLRLRDVMDRLDFLRGKGMADLYSWSCKRSYRNGFVWHDLSEDDLIHPVHGHEYVLMGSEHQQPVSFPGSGDSNAGSSGALPEVPERANIRRKRAPWSSFDLGEYKIDLVTDRAEFPPVTELEAEEISPPPSSSSPETADQHRTVGSYAGGRMRASAVLLHVLSCGSINVKEHHGLTAPEGRLKERAAAAKDVEGNGVARVQLEDREYFSGSLIEMKKKGAGDDSGDFRGLKRSSSYHHQGSHQGRGKEKSRGVPNLAQLSRQQVGQR